MYIFQLQESHNVTHTDQRKHARRQLFEDGRMKMDTCEMVTYLLGDTDLTKKFNKYYKLQKHTRDCFILKTYDTYMAEVTSKLAALYYSLSNDSKDRKWIKRVLDHIDVAPF